MLMGLIIKSLQDHRSTPIVYRNLASKAIEMPHFISGQKDPKLLKKSNLLSFVRCHTITSQEEYHYFMLLSTFIYVMRERIQQVLLYCLCQGMLYALC